MPVLKPGTRMRSAVCTTEVMVIQAPAADLELTCGGAAMLPLGTEPQSPRSPAPGLDGGTLIGKRYVSAAGDLELLCTKPGAGSLALGSTPLAVKSAKPLPSSD